VVHQTDSENEDTMKPASIGDEADQLHLLARARFGPMTQAETRLLVAVRLGETAVCEITANSEDPTNDLFNPAGWGVERRIRSALIRWLCIDRAAREKIDPRGLRMRGAFIGEHLDLSCLSVPFPIGFANCVLNDGLDISFATLMGLDLSLSYVSYIKAESLTVKDSFWFRRCWCIGPVSLMGAHIGGDLACDGTKLGDPPSNQPLNSPGVALNAQQIVVQGCVLLREGFSAKGLVWLSGATIGGSLECGKATFHNPPLADRPQTGSALVLQSAKIGGAVLLREGFVADGQVQMRYASIGGDADFRSGRFNNPVLIDLLDSGIALKASGVMISGSLTMSDGFRAEGRVDLDDAKIKGSVVCTECSFLNPLNADLDRTGVALNAEDIQVGGSVQLREAFVAQGIVWLAGASVAGVLACDGAKFLNPTVFGMKSSGLALMAAHAKINGGLFLNDGFVAEGCVSFAQAEIGRNILCDQGRFKNPAVAGSANEGLAIDFEAAKIAGSVLLRDGFTAEGQVRLYRAAIGGSLICDGGKVINPAASSEASGIALDAEGADIAGSVFFRAGFSSEGQVRMFRVTVGGSIESAAATFTNPVQKKSKKSGVALLLDDSRVSSHVLLRYEFSAQGLVGISNCIIGGSLECDQGKFDNPSRAGTEASGMALVAEHSKIQGSVLLRNGFVAMGAVHLFGAEIGQSLECDHGSFLNPTREGEPNSGMALNLKEANIFGSVLLRNGFKAEGLVNLYSTQVKGDLILINGRIESLGLINASVDAIWDEESGWPKRGKLFLDGLTYQRISSGPSAAASRLQWLQRQDPFTRHPYRQLAKILRDSGDESGARQVSAKMQENVWKARGWRFSPLSVLLRATIGYGYFSLRALWWLLAISILGSLVYDHAYYAGRMVPTEKGAYDDFIAEGELPGYYNAFHPLFYSLENSFPLVRLGIQDKWGVITDGQRVKEKARTVTSLPWAASPTFIRWFRFAQICIGWVLATLFVGGVSGLVRKE
jgi:hypothetical protein